MICHELVVVWKEFDVVQIVLRCENIRLFVVVNIVVHLTEIRMYISYNIGRCVLFIIIIIIIIIAISFNARIYINQPDMWFKTLLG